MSYKVLKAYLGFENIESNPSFNYSFNFSYEITDKFKNYLNQKKIITINSSLSQFGYDIADLATPDIFQKIATDGFDKKKNQLKLTIQMHNDEENKVDVFVFIRDKGWVIRDQNGIKIEASKSPAEQIMISQNGYHSISGGEDAADAAAIIADLFGLSPPKKAALLILARKGGINTSALIAKAIEFAKDKAPFAFTEASIRFDRTVSDEATKQLQRCLIRIAGGNLESERKHLRGPNYPISSDRWRAEYGPIFAKGKADNGYYIEDTKDAIIQLKPFIDSIQPGLIDKDAMEVKFSILTSPVCAGLIGDVTAEERKNSRSKTPMPVPAANQQKVPEITDVPKPAPTAPPAPAVPPAPIKTDSQLKIENLIKTYKNMYTYTEMIKIISDEERTYFARTGNLKKRLQEIDTKVIEWLKRVNTGNKNVIVNEVKNYSRTLQKEYTVGVTSKFNNKAISFLYDLISRIDALTVESKIYKDYGFLSTKNKKLHSVLMEQLKKDLKRG